MIFVWMGALTVLTASIVVLPLARMKGVDQAAEPDSTPAVLLDQLDEVQRDLDRNVISQSEATAAQVEIKRRILAAARRESSTPKTEAASGRAGLIVAALIVPIVAIGYYTLMGSPEMSSLAFADRQGERAERQQIVELTDKLYKRLITESDGGATDGWMLLGQTYSRMGEFQKAADALEIVSVRDDATSASFSMLAEALINVENGIVTPKSEAAIDRAIALDATNPAGIFYKSIALDQRGDEAAAHDMLLAKLEVAEGFAAWMEPFIEQANRIGEKLGRAPVSLVDYAPMVSGNSLSGAGPTKEDVAAASEMSAEDRGAFILSMVDRLASRLEENPEDLDGWIKLANAYKVLGDKPKALSALEQASGLLASIDAKDPRHNLVASELSKLSDK